VGQQHSGNPATNLAERSSAGQPRAVVITWLVAFCRRTLNFYLQPFGGGADFGVVIAGLLNHFVDASIVMVRIVVE
jgi:hypothetical protein